MPFHFPLLLIVTNLNQDDHWMCPNISHDFDIRLTFDLDIVVTGNLAGTYLTHHKNLSSTCLFVFVVIISKVGVLPVYTRQATGTSEWK